MAQSILDMIFRTKKTGDGEKQAATGLRGLAQEFENMTGFTVSTAAALGAFVAGLKMSVAAAGEAEVIQAQLNAVIKSTGGVAGITSEEAGNLADELSKLTGIEDDLIAKQEAVMLTFTAIGEEIFPDAMSAALNMSAALGQDLQSSVIQLGKALNDPITGVTALQRVGVRLTEQQREQIKAMVESGDVMGAQKLILQELQTEFGGAAEAMGDTMVGSSNKLKNSIGNLAEAIGSGLLPVLTEANKEAATWIERVTDEIVATNDLGQALMTAYKARVISEEEMIDILNRHRDGELELQDALALVTGRLQDYQLWLGNAVTASEQYSDAGIRVESAAIAAAAAIDEEAEALASVEERMDALSALMKGEVGKENEKFAEQTATLTERAEDLRAKIAELEGKKYLTQDQRDELADLRTELGETETAITDLADAHDDATKRILFNMLEQRLAADELTTAEVEMLENLAKEWGLVDDATAAAMDATREAAAIVVQAGTDSETASKRVDMFYEAWAALDSLGQLKNFAVRVRAEFEEQLDSWNGELNPYGTNNITSGGQVINNNTTNNLTINAAGGVVDPLTSLEILEAQAGAWQ